MAKSPTCCCCMNIRCGTMALAIIYVVCGCLGAMGSVVQLAKGDPYYYNNEFNDEFNDEFNNEFNSYHAPNKTVTFASLFGDILVVVFASLVIHGIRSKRAGLLLPMFVSGVLSIVGSSILIVILCIYWNTIYFAFLTILEEMHSTQLESFRNMGVAGCGAIFIGILIFFLLLGIYFTSVFYRCYKDIQMEPRIAGPISTLAWQQASVQHTHVYTPARVPDVQKIPLVDDMEPVDVMPPAYMAQMA